MSCSFKNRLCRLCLDGHENKVNIFEEKIKMEFKVQDVIEDILKYQVVREIVYPWLVCSSCLCKLNDFRIFKQRCIESIYVFENRGDNGDSPEEGHWTEFETPKIESTHSPDDDYGTTGSTLGRAKDGTHGGGGTCESTWTNSASPETIIPSSASLKRGIGSPFHHEDGTVDRTDSCRPGDPKLQGNENYYFLDEVNKTSTVEHTADGMYAEGEDLVAGTNNGSSYETIIHPLCASPKIEIESSFEEDIAVHDGSVGQIESEDEMMEVEPEDFACPPGVEDTYVVGDNERLGDETEGDDDHEWQMPDEQGADEKIKDSVRRLCGKEEGNGESIHMYQHNGKNGEWECEKRSALESDDGIYDTTESSAPVLGAGQASSSSHSDVGNMNRFEITQESITTKPKLKEDVVFYTNGKSHTCEVRGNIFHSTSLLQKHECDICPKACHKMHLLKKQMTTHTGLKPFNCNLGLATFSHESTLEKHPQKHKVEKPYKCNECSATYTQNSSLKRHLQTHTGETPYKCNLCSAAFSQKHFLIYHFRTHTEEKPYKCSVCAAEFTLNKYLKRHLRIHKVEKPYKCNVCSAVYTENSSLKRHLLTHTGEMLYKCKLCSAEFSQKNTWKNHHRIHTEGKPYMCSVCSAAFSHKYNLKMHLLKHPGEKPYKCNVCSAGFSLKSNFKCHLRKHTGEKPYKCNVCSTAFSLLNTLKNHIRTHTGERPYKCNVCSAAFSRQFILNKHLRSHTGEQPYKCSVCSAAFTQNSSLKRHLRTIHRTEVI